MKVAMLIPDNRDEFRRHADPEPVFGPAPTALLNGLAQLPECEVHIFSCVQRPVRAPEKLGPNLFYHALHVPKWGWMRGGYLGCVRAVRAGLRVLRPDLVHGQGTERYCALAAARSGFPNLITIHGNMRAVARANHARPFSFHWLAARLEGFTVPRAGGVVCLSRYTQATVAGEARRTWVVPNAVAEEFFSIPRAKTPSRKILCVGHVCAHKNQNRLLVALDGLAQETGLELVFLGTASPEEPYGREFFHLLAERPWARHSGFVGRTELKQYLADAAVLVLPSLEDNCPMVVLEAMATGLPVAAASIGGVPDLVEDGVTGLLFDPLVAEQMCAAVGRLIKDPALAAAMAAAAKTRTQERCSSLAVARRHLEVYHEMIEERGRIPPPGADQRRATT